MRKVVLKKDTPVSLVFKGKEVMRVMVQVDRYGEPTALVAMKSQDGSCGYDWSVDAHRAISRAMVAEQEAEETAKTAVIAWTDYPFTVLGDKEGEKALVRMVAVLAYDGDKYCQVQLHGGHVKLIVKAGYLYSEVGRFGGTTCLSQEVLNSLPLLRES
jgi:hypothetical protein